MNAKSTILWLLRDPLIWISVAISIAAGALSSSTMRACHLGALLAAVACIPHLKAGDWLLRRLPNQLKLGTEALTVLVAVGMASAAPLLVSGASASWIPSTWLQVSGLTLLLLQFRIPASTASTLLIATTLGVPALLPDLFSVEQDPMGAVSALGLFLGCYLMSTSRQK